MDTHAYFSSTKPFNFFKVLLSNGAFIMMALVLIAFSHPVLAQDEHGKEAKESNNVVLFSLGFTFIPSASNLNSTEAQGYFVPSIGLDYVRRFGKRWEFGIMLDYELAHYVIVANELERENAFIIAIGPSYRLVDNVYLFAGPGIELEKNKTLFVLRTGVEYAVHFKKNWELAPGFFFDWKHEFHTYTLALAAGYNF